MIGRILLSLLLLFSVSSRAQSADYFQKGSRSDTTLYKVETKDGSVFIGRIISEDSAYIGIVTLSQSQVRVPRSQVVERSIISDVDIHKGRYWFPNPNATRYLFAPSALMLDPGEGYYQNTYLLLNSFNVGVTKNFSMGGGFELISLFAKGSGGPIFYLTPKVGFKLADKFHAGAGVYYVNVPDFFNGARAGAGILYGIGTYGTSNSNVTLGAGWGFLEEEGISSRPVLTFSGMHRIARKTALVSENWLLPSGDGYYGLYSYGIRFFGEKVAVDLAFLNNADLVTAILIGIPYVDFVVKF